MFINSTAAVECVCVSVSFDHNVGRSFFAFFAIVNVVFGDLMSQIGNGFAGVIRELFNRCITVPFVINHME